jgi:hypothetical protein
MPHMDAEQIPSLMSRFLAILSPEPWRKRYRALQAAVERNPMLESLLVERHGLEFAMGELLESETPSIDLSVPSQYRLATFAAMVALVYDHLDAAGQKRIAGLLRDGLGKNRGLLPFMNEIETIVHLLQMGFEVSLSDIEAQGRFDFLISRDGSQDGIEMEVECKSVSNDLGRKIHPRRARELAGRLQSVLREVLASRPGGVLMQVTFPGRLPDEQARFDQIAKTISHSLRTGVGLPGPSPCTIELCTFDLSEMPSGEPHIDQATLREWVISKTGNRNPNVLFMYRPGQSAVVLVHRSREPDEFVPGLMHELKRAAKGQFTKTRPAVLVVQFLELDPDALRRVASADTSDPTRASAIQIATNQFLAGSGRAHIHTVVYRSTGDLRQSRQITGEELIRSYQEQGAAYSFRNWNHPMAADSRCAIFPSDRSVPVRGD